MDGFMESVMVALLPTESSWCRQNLPHLTLVYVGEIPDLSLTVHGELLKAAMTISMSFGPLTLAVMGVERFGEPDNPVDVLLLENTPRLSSIQLSVEQWSASIRVDEFPFTPHCTIGPPGAIVGITVPEQISFDRVLVAYGSENTSYKLVG